MNVVKIVDSEEKAKKLEALGYEEIKEEKPEPKKKAPARKTTKEG